MAAVAVALLLGGCSATNTTSPSTPSSDRAERFVEDCAVITEATGETLGGITDAIAGQEPTLRRMQAAVSELPDGSKERTLRALTPQERDEWLTSARMRFQAEIDRGLARSWPLLEDEDLADVTRGIAEGSNVETNYEAFSVMCPQTVDVLDDRWAQVQDFIEQQAQARTEPVFE